MRRTIFAIVLLLFAFNGFAQSVDGTTTITPSVPPGSYAADQTVALVTNDNAELYFTFEESRDQAFTRYTVPIRLNSLDFETRTYTLRVEARKNGVVLKKKEFLYVIDRDPPEVPGPSVSPGTYFETVNVMFGIQDLNEGETLYTSIVRDEISDPVSWDGLPIVLEGSEGMVLGYEIRGYVMDLAGNTSRLKSWYYVIDQSVRHTPDSITVLSPVPGTFVNKQHLLIDTSEFDEIKYTLDGSDPVENGFVYEGAQLIDRTGAIVLRIAGMAQGLATPRTAEVRFTVTANRMERFKPESGVYDEELVITLSDTGAIRYTLDETPSRDYGIEYTGPIRLSLLPNAMQFIPLRYTAAEGAGEYRFAYFIDDRTPPQPRIDLPVTGPISGPVTVSIDAPPFAAVYITTDGTTPDDRSIEYTGPFELELPKNREAGSILLKALAIGGNGRSSSVASTLVNFDLVPPEAPEITNLRRAGPGGFSVGVSTEFGSIVHYEISLDDTTPAPPTTASPVIADSLILEVPYGMERMFTLRFASADSAGNISSPTEPFGLIVDRVPPPSPVISERDGTITIQGSGTLYYTITDDGSLPALPDRSATRYTSPIDLVPITGKRTTYRIRAVAVDTSGNTSAPSDLFTRSFDERIPKLPVIRGAVDGASYPGMVRVGLETSSDDIDVRYTFALNGPAPEPDVLSPRLIDILELAGRDGEVVEYELKLIPVIASTGAAGTVKTIHFTVDRDPPEIPVFTQTGTTVYRNTHFELEAPENYGDTLRYALSDTVDGSLDPFGEASVTFGEPITFDAPIGESRRYFLVLGAEDVAGNRVTDDRTYEITIDREPPETPSISGIPATNISREAVVLDLRSESDIRYVITSDGSQPVFNPADARRYTGPIILSGEDAKEIVYTMLYFSVDRAANTSEPGYVQVTIDRKPPAIPRDPEVVISDTGEYLFAFSNSSNAQVYYRIGDSDTGTFVPFSEPTVLSGSADGTAISFYSRDRAGNQSEVRRIVVSASSSSTSTLVTGVTDRETYNARQRLVRARTEGVTRYELRSDGIDPLPVGRYSPEFPQVLDLNAEVGRTNFFSLRLAWYRNASDVIPGKTELIRFVIDRNPPPAPSISLSGSELYSRRDLEIELTSPEGDIYVSVNGRSYTRYGTGIELTAEDGTIKTYDISAYTRDSAQNRSVRTGEWQVIIDKSDIYVSVAGNDLYDGSRSRPFRTIERAVQEALETRRSVINIASGTYVLRSSLTVTKDLVFRGGRSTDTWDYSDAIPTTIVATNEFNGGPMFAVEASDLELTSIEIKSETPATDRGVIEAVNSSVVLTSVFVHSEIVRRTPLLSFRGSDVALTDSRIDGTVEGGPVIEISDADIVTIDDSTLSAFAADGSTQTVSFLRSPSVEIRNSRIVGGEARSVTSVKSVESTIHLENTIILAGIGRSTSIGVSLFDSTLRSIDCLFEGEARSWITTLLDAKFSNVLLTTSKLLARGSRGAVGITTESTSIDIGRSLLRGENAREFIYLIQASNSNGSVVNSMLSSGGSRDQIAVDLSDSPLSLYHDSIYLAQSDNLAIGLRTQRGAAPYLVNTFLATGTPATTKTSVAIQLARGVQAPRLLGNAFGGFAVILKHDTAIFRTPAEINRILDADPEGGSVQLNIPFVPGSAIEIAESGEILTDADSALVNAGIDLNLIGLRIVIDYHGDLRPLGRTARSSGYDIGAEEVK